MKIYVNCAHCGPQNGSKEAPFATISQAAAAAMPGDEIIVAPGIYREDVNPLRGGNSSWQKITYRSEEPLKAVISGAEVLDQWIDCGGGIWKTTLSNDRFLGDNPFADIVYGDWYYYHQEEPVHRADVFVDDRSMLEVFSMEALEKAEPSPFAWDPDAVRDVWMSEIDDKTTTIYVHLHSGSPADHVMEYSARRHCFYPQKTGVNYITLSGFTVCKACPQWAPPTAYQEGMIGPHWSKGWVIEECEVYESKCVGISLGKYLQPQNENKWFVNGLKHGTQNERDAICQAQNEGWNKDNIGSHTIRRCHIHNCGQAGIVGHLGCVFCVIEDNHIHHINNKQELNGAEIGGIKLHAAIDTILARNHIHHCTRGLWLDWQAQGTRVTGNSFHHNQPVPGRALRSQLSFGEDIFVEVSHGPTLIDHNLLLSQAAGRISTQGIAFVQNLIAGSFTFVGGGTMNAGVDHPESVRYTPYHVPHGTAVAGFMSILHGDAQFLNNIFVQQDVPQQYMDYIIETDRNRLNAMNMQTGTIPYENYPTWEQYLKTFTRENITGNRAIYYTELPVTAKGNVYFNGAKSANCEVDPVHVDKQVQFDLTDDTLTTDLYRHLPEVCTAVVNSDVLGIAFESEQRYEQPDGSDLVLDTDFFGVRHEEHPLPGPFAHKPEDCTPLWK